MRVIYRILSNLIGNWAFYFDRGVYRKNEESGCLLIFEDQFKTFFKTF